MEAAIGYRLKNHLRSVLKRTLPRSIVDSITKARYVREVRGHFIPEFKVIRCLIKPGDVVIDLGANFGWYTKFMSEIVQKEGNVYCVEPIPANYKVLEGIIRSLGLENVQSLHYAISDKYGIQTMAVPVNGSGEENLYEAKIVDDPMVSRSHTIKVETRTLDSLFADLPNGIEFIKCDIEGHELKCLKGAKEIIGKFHPAWLIEVWGDPDDTLSQGFETFQLLLQSGYQAYIFDGKSLNRRKTGERQNDYFFLMPYHIDRLHSTNTLNIGST